MLRAPDLLIRTFPILSILPVSRVFCLHVHNHWVEPKYQFKDLQEPIKNFFLIPHGVKRKKAGFCKYGIFIQIKSASRKNYACVVLSYSDATWRTILGPLRLITR
jgi:hypothetical protein